MSVDALQDTLTLEHAAVHFYALLGAQTSQSSSPTLYDGLRAAYTLHRSRRDLLTGWIRDAGDEPVAAAPAYDDPPPFGSSDEIAAAAAEAERGLAAGYAQLVAVTVADRRRWAADALTDAAIRGLGFGDDPTPLPGWK